MINLPCAFQVGQEVMIDFQNSKSLQGGCKIAAVKFTDYGKVIYDVYIPFGFEDFTVLKDIDSVLIKDVVV